MAITNDTRRLDELVKQTLSDYVAPDATPDWVKMESILGVASKAGSDKMNFPSFGNADGTGLIKRVASSYIVIVALMIAGGGYLLYTILKAPKTEDASAVVVAPPVDTVATPAAMQSPAIIAPAGNETAVVGADNKQNDTTIAKTEMPVEVKKQEEPVVAKKETTDKKEAELSEKKKSEKAEADKLKAEEKKREEKKEEKRKAEKKEKEKQLAAKEEKEKKGPPKDTLKKFNNPIGLNFLRSVNLDSIKKQQSVEPAPSQPSQPKDTVKTP